MDKKHRCSVCGINFATWREHLQHLQSKAHRDIANKGNIQLFLEKLSAGIEKLNREE